MGERQGRRRVLGLAGSPRRHGNSEILLDEALRGAEENTAVVEKLVVSRLKIKPCLACNHCARTGECIQKDEMQPLYPQLLQADSLMVAAPNFFYGLPSQLKALIDRCQKFWNRRYILHQQLRQVHGKGYFIGVGATSGQKLFDGAILTIKYFFDSLEVNYEEELLVRGVEEKGEVKADSGLLHRAYELGREAATDSLQTPPPCK